MSNFTARNRIAIELTLNNGAPLALHLDVKFGSTVTPYTLGVGNEIVDAGQGVYRYTFVPSDEQSGTWGYRWWGIDSQGQEFAVPNGDDDVSKYRTFTVF